MGEYNNAKCIYFLLFFFILPKFLTSRVSAYRCCCFSFPCAHSKHNWVDNVSIFLRHPLAWTGRQKECGFMLHVLDLIFFPLRFSIYIRHKPTVCSTRYPFLLRYVSLNSKLGCIITHLLSAIYRHSLILVVLFHF